MNRFTTFTVAAALSAAVATIGCQNKDHEEHHHTTAATGPVAGVTNTLGGAAHTTGDVAGGAAKTTGDVAGGAAHTTGDVAGGAAKTTGDAAKTTGEVAVGAAKTTGDVAGGAAKKTGEVAVGAAKTTGDAVEDAGKKTGDAVAGAADKTGDTVAGAADLAADKVEGKAAVAHLMASKSPGNDDVKGVVHFTQKGDTVHVHAMISGLEPDSEHGFHIHQKADLTAPDLKSAGDHFNPTHAKHGGPEGDMRHGGDLGNVKADDKGNANYDVDVMGISIDGKENGIIGHSVILHAKADDLKTDPSGNSGDRIAGGAITADAGKTKTAPAGEKDASNDARKDQDNAK